MSNGNAPLSHLTRLEKEELLRRLRSSGQRITPRPDRITPRRRAPAMPDIQRLPVSQVEHRLSRLLAGSSPRHEQLRKELPRLGLEARRTLLARLLGTAYSGVSKARLSFAQQRSWFMQSLAPESPAQNIVGGVRAEGPLDVRLLEQCLNIVIQRHESLRTNFVMMDDEPVQLIFPTRHVRIVEHAFTDVPPAGRREAAMSLMAEEAYRPIDLTKDPLIRMIVFQVEPEDRLLLLKMHHIVGDEWSIGVLLEELGALYAHGANPACLPPLQVQYADYAEWEGDAVTPESMKAQLAWWKQKLAGANMTLEVPTDRPRPEVQTMNGKMESLLLTPSSFRSIAAFARSEQATPFIAMLAAFNVLLLAETGRLDILVGTDFASRSRPEVARLIGFFVNELVFRTDLSANPTFRELIRSMRGASREVFQNQDVPFQWLVEELRLPRDRSRTPVFQVVFNLHNVPLVINFQGIRLSPMRLPLRPAKYDLTMFISETPQDTWALLEYNTDLYDRSTAQRLLADYQNILTAACADPDSRVLDLAAVVTPRVAASSTF